MSNNKMADAKACVILATFTPFTTQPSYEGWNFNSGNYLFTTDTK